MVEVEVPADRKDINANYDMFVQQLRQPRSRSKGKMDARTRQEDYFRNFRTRVVLFWMFTNAVIIVLLTSDAMAPLREYANLRATGSFNPYLQVTNNNVL
jgi:chitin synthase